jgi:hypothetical protein
MAVLPVRVRPAPGECIDSWLEATALAMGSTLGAVVRWLDLSTAPKPQWISWIPQHEMEALACITGIRANHIEAMTLSAYTASRSFDMALSMGQHTNDKELSFYAMTPSGFE